MTFLDARAIKFRKALMQPINTSAAIILGLYTFVWGVWVANPIWSVFETAEVYATLMSIFPEYAWGLIAIICGSFMVYGCVSSKYKHLVRGSFVGAIHWLVIGICYFLGDWHHTGGITAIMIAVYCSFVYLNLRVNRIVYEKDGKKVVIYNP